MKPSDLTGLDVYVHICVPGNGIAMSMCHATHAAIAACNTLIVVQHTMTCSHFVSCFLLASLQYFRVEFMSWEYRPGAQA